VAQLDQPDPHVGMGGVPGAQGGWEHSERHRVDGRQLQLAAVELDSAARGRPGAFGVGEGGAGVREQRAAHRGRAHRARQPLQQPPARLLLQRADLVGERGLGDVQLRRGPGERPGVDHGDQVLELAQDEHARNLSQP
jgi:hypothetical protein